MNQIERATRLKVRRAELKRKVKELKADPAARNMRHKIAHLNSEITAIDNKLTKLARTEVAGQ